MSEAKDYGEPWHITLVSTGQRGSASTVIHTNRSYAICNCIDHEQRAVACVNACQGIDDPASAIAAAREALAAVDYAIYHMPLHPENPDHDRLAIARSKATAALLLLTPERKETT